MRILLVTLLPFLAVAPAMADVYKWFDDSGKVHYTQTPPMDRPSILIRTSTSGAPRTQPVSPATSRQPAKETKEGETDEAGETLEVIDSEKLARYCSDQRKALETLRRAKRVTIRVNGEIRELSHEEKMERIRKTERNLAEYCKND